jgi:glycosyltransferase involved in cell wall biosynthesis
MESEKIIVAYPTITFNKTVLVNKKRDAYTFFYPSYPRIFKNIEIICEAARILSRDINCINFEVLLTISGTENNYSEWLYNKYGYLKQIKFVGVLSHSQVENYYAVIDCLIFPSKLETWGLPITEFTQYKKPMMVADLPYAHETVGDNIAVAYFDPDSAMELAEKMKLLINGDSSFLINNKRKYVKEPFVSSWEKLFDILLK